MEVSSFMVRALTMSMRLAKLHATYIYLPSGETSSVRAPAPTLQPFHPLALKDRFWVAEAMRMALLRLSTGTFHTIPLTLHDAKFVAVYSEMPDVGNVVDEADVFHRLEVHDGYRAGHAADQHVAVTGQEDRAPQQIA